MIPEIATAAKPTISAGRAPKITRARRSRPRWSVPSICKRPDGSREPAAGEAGAAGGGPERRDDAAAVRRGSLMPSAAEAAVIAGWPETRCDPAALRLASFFPSAAEAAVIAGWPETRCAPAAFRLASSIPSAAEAGVIGGWPEPGAPRLRSAWRLSFHRQRTAASSQTDPGVEVRVEHIHPQVHEHEGAGEQEHCRLDHRVVAVVDRLHRQAPDTRPRADRLGG